MSTHRRHRHVVSFLREPPARPAFPAARTGGSIPPADARVAPKTPTLDPRLTFTRASTATCFDSTGVMRTAAVNAPRWDYSPTALTLNGLLIEEARTNMLVQSNTITGWSTSAITKTAASGIAPDGTNTMVREQETAVTNFHFTGPPVLTTVAATVYTFSVYAKAQQNRYVQLVFDDNTSSGVVANFDLLGGVISSGPNATGSGTNVSGAIQAVGNGVYRCSVTAATNTTTTARLGITLINTATAGKFASYAGNVANGLLTWGAQFEQGAFPTSYIATAGAAVTRSVEGCTMPVGAWYAASPSPGALVVEALQLGLWNKGTAYVALAQAGGRTSINVTGGNTVNIYDSTGGVNTSLGAVPLVPFKASYTFAPGSQRGCMNGGTVRSAAAATLTAGVATLGIGCLSATGQQANGYVRRVRYWPRFLTDAELQALTL